MVMDLLSSSLPIATTITEAGQQVVKHATCPVNKVDAALVNAVAANGKDATAGNQVQAFTNPTGRGHVNWAVGYDVYQGGKYTIYGLPKDKEFVGVSRNWNEVYVKDGEGFWKMNIEPDWAGSFGPHTIWSYTVHSYATKVTDLVIAYTTVTETNQGEIRGADSGYIKVGGLTDADTGAADTTRDNFFVPSEMELLLPDGTSISGEELKKSLMKTTPVASDQNNGKIPWTTRSWGWHESWFFHEGIYSYEYKNRYYNLQGENIKKDIQVNAKIHGTRRDSKQNWTEVVESITITKAGTDGGQWTVPVDNSASEHPAVDSLGYHVGLNEYTHGIGSLK